MTLPIIRLFSFYLALLFVISTYLRLRQYRAVLSLVVRLQRRWPNLAKLVLAHRSIFMTWNTYWPLAVVLVLFVVNTFASWVVWPQAGEFALRDLLHLWWAVPVVAAAGVSMFVFDLWGLSRVAEIDEAAVEKHFDLAESWLEGWKAPVVRVLSLGFVNPRKIVTAEVRTALEGVSQTLSRTLWWVSIQTGLRILFGLSLWLTYALGRYLG